MWAWLVSLWQAWRDPFDVADSDYPGDLADGIDCPDTMPTSPGALDTDRGDP